MSEVEFEIDEVYIGSHNYKDLVKDQYDFPACACYAVGDVIKYITGCHISPFLAFLEINDGQPSSFGCSKLKVVMQRAVDCGFWKEESLNEYPIMKKIKSDNNPTTQALNSSQVNTHHMDTLYGIKEFREVFIQADSLKKETKEEKLKSYLKEFNVPIVIAVSYIDFKELKHNPKLLNAHAVTVYGWNKHGFRFKNSWGPMTGNNLYNNGKAIFPYQYTDNIFEAYCAMGIQVLIFDKATGFTTLRPDLGFGHFRANEKEVKIPQEVTKANVQNLLSELKYIKNSVQSITLSKIADADRESVKKTVIETFSNRDEWPGLKYVAVKVESCPKDYLYRR